MTPQVLLTIDGQPISSKFSRRIIGVTVEDREGISSDKIDIELNDFPPAAIPRTGAIVRCKMGYGANLIYMGAFEIEEPEVEFVPYKMKLTGKAAGFRGKAKQNKERHWDDITLGKLASQIAEENGFTPKISDEMASVHFDWIGQMNESDFHFLQRVVERAGGLMGGKDRNLVVTKIGTGKSISGQDLKKIIVTEDNLIFGTGRVTFSDRFKYKSVKASYQDKAKVDRLDEESSSSADASAAYRINETFQDKNEAKRAADAKASELKRNTIKFSCSIIGDPAAKGGSPLEFQGLRPGVDGIPFIIDAAKTSYVAKGGMKTDLSGYLKA